MNEENGYVVPDSQPNLRSINPYASRPEDPEYVNPDACSRNNKYENVIGASKPVVELPKDKYGYITLQVEDSVLPSGVYSSIVDARSNLPVGPGADVCDDLKVTTSKEEIDVSWRRRFYILLVIYVLVVSGLLIPLIYSIVNPCLKIEAKQKIIPEIPIAPVAVKVANITDTITQFHDSAFG